MEKEQNKDNQETEIFTNLKYICKSTQIITESLQKGLDVSQLQNGDLIISEVKTINTQYIWDEDKGRMIKSNKI